MDEVVGDVKVVMKPSCSLLFYYSVKGVVRVHGSGVLMLIHRLARDPSHYVTVSLKDWGFSSQ